MKIVYSPVNCWTICAKQSLKLECKRNFRYFFVFHENRLNCQWYGLKCRAFECKIKQIIEINVDRDIDCTIHTHKCSDGCIIFECSWSNASSYVRATQVFFFCGSAIDDVSNNENWYEQKKQQQLAKTKTCWIAVPMINEFPTRNKQTNVKPKQQKL